MGKLVEVTIIRHEPKSHLNSEFIVFDKATDQSNFAEFIRPYGWEI